MRVLLVAFSAADIESSAGFIAKIGESDVLLLCGDQIPQAGQTKSFTAGFTQIPTSDNLAKALSAFAESYDIIASVSSMQSKDLLARVAGCMDRPMVTDVTAILGDNTFNRPIVAGSIIETLQVTEPRYVLTFRPSAFKGGTVSGSASAESVQLAIESKSTLVSRSAAKGGRPDLSQAKIIVTGGRPLKDAVTFEAVVGACADAVGGAVGATRAAVDSGIAPNDLQVGQTGKIVAPDLYIAAGVSGSTQHMAGIKDSKVIVAINTDPDAPIFEAADLGLVQDLFTALPELQTKLAEKLR